MDIKCQLWCPFPLFFSRDLMCSAFQWFWWWRWWWWWWQPADFSASMMYDMDIWWPKDQAKDVTNGDQCCNGHWLIKALIFHLMTIQHISSDSPHWFLIWRPNTSPSKAWFLHPLTRPCFPWVIPLTGSSWPSLGRWCNYPSNANALERWCNYRCVVKFLPPEYPYGIPTDRYDRRKAEYRWWNRYRYV